MAPQIFINLAVKDLNKSKEFFSKLGFTFNAQFTNESGACMVIDDGHIYTMLITEPFYKTFTKKDIADAHKVSETLIALSQDSKENVDRIADAALANGGTAARPIEDNGRMYTRAIDDLDGHTWEIFFMDMSKVPANPTA